MFNLSRLFFPTILIHGFGGDISDLNNLKISLEERGVQVFNTEIGNGKIDSIFMNMNKQCDILAENIENLSIKGKINLIGISQGGLLARCYVEKYSNKINLVHSLITYGTPHMGIYIEWANLKNLEYWKNPYKYNQYLDKNDFLVYLNNEKIHEEYNLYKKNIINLDNFVIIWSNIDKVITPLVSTRFEFYNITEAENNKPMPIDIVKLYDSKMYIDDNIGLLSLNKKESLFIKRYDCLHEEFKNPSCYLNDNFNNDQLNLLNFTLKML